jgi:hypothetical protein
MQTRAGPRGQVTAFCVPQHGYLNQYSRNPPSPPAPKRAVESACQNDVIEFAHG